MATVINSRDTYLQSQSPRVEAWTLGSNVSMEGDLIGTINGTDVADILNVELNFNNRNDRISGPVIDPTVLSDGTAIDHVINTDGSCDISFEWEWSGSEPDIDGFFVFVRQSSSSSPYTIGTSPGQEVSVFADSSKRAFILYGVPVNRYYTFGIQAYRVVDSDISAAQILKSTLIQPSLGSENPYRPSSSVSFSGDVIGTIDGVSPNGVKNSSITLSSNGVLSGAGGGSITNLDYSNVSGTKPPANATQNIFTTSTSDPSGGANGDAHFNTSTDTMWFKVGGIWERGGTVNASSIVTGTLAAARIAANSITSDKINVSSLSAITANLGTVTAGSINTTGTIQVKGGVSSGGYTASGHFNGNENSLHGIVTRGNSGAGGAALIAIGSGIATAIECQGRANFSSNIFQTGGSTTLRSVTVNSGGLSVSSGTLSCGLFSTSSTSLVSNLYAQQARELKGQEVSSNELQFLRGVLTGSSTATFVGTNKPGSSSSNTWMKMRIDSTTIYVPVWT